MFERIFGWSKASKCKALVKIVISRVKLLRNKRSTIVKQLRRDIGQLLRNGEFQSSFKRVESLFREQNLLDGYDMVEQFCECILQRLSYIRRHKDRPQDINEAVSSLIFASARCADLPELQRLRSLFAKRYGFDFASAAVELHSHSCVKQQIVEKLSVSLPTLDLKLKLIKDIAADINLQLDSLYIEGELPKATTDLLRGSKGSEKFKSCQNGVDSSFHPSLRASCIDGIGNFSEFSVSQMIKEQKSEFSKEQNETLAEFTGHEDKIFERDIPVISSSIKEILVIPDKTVKSSGIEKQEPFSSEIGLKNGRNNLGQRSNGHKVVKGRSFDSSCIENLKTEDLDYRNANAAEPEAGVTSLGENLSTYSNLPTEGKLFDCPLNYTSENEKNMSDPRPLKSKHSRPISTAENGHSKSQTCFPERREVLIDRDSDPKLARYLSPTNSQKSKSMPNSSDCNGERQRLHNCPKGQSNTGIELHQSNIEANKLGRSGTEEDTHRWCSPRPKYTKADIQKFAIVDDIREPERSAEVWNMRDKECYFKDSIEIDLTSTKGHRSKHRSSSRTRKKGRPETRRRHSLSSHYPLEINGLHHDYYNSSDIPEDFGTLSSTNKNKGRDLYTKKFVKPEGGGTFRKYSDCGTNTRFYEGKVRSLSCNGHRISYDMMDSYFDSSSDDETSTISNSIYRARDPPPPGIASPVGGDPHKRQHRVEHTLHSFGGSLSRKNLHQPEDYDSDMEQHFQQSNDARQRSKPNPMRNYKCERRLYEVGETIANKPQRRNRSLDLSQKQLYDIDIDSQDLEDQYVRQSHSKGKLRKSKHSTNSESGRRSFGHRNHESNPCGGGSKSLKSCEEPEPECEGYDGFTAKRIENFCSPRVSFVYIDRLGRPQRHYNVMHDMEENDYNQIFIERQGIHEADCSPVRGQHADRSNLKDRNATYNLAKNGKMESRLYDADNSQNVRLYMIRNPSSAPDQVESLNQSVCGEKASMGKISNTMMHQRKNCIKRNAASATPPKPPLSPATPSLVSSESRAHSKPSSPLVGPPQRPPPKLPRTWERVMSLPPERSNASPVRSSKRSQSMQFSVDSPRTPHVHPKLPDYDALAAQFKALKQQHMTSTASE